MKGRRSFKVATKPVPTSEEELASRELRVVSVVSLRAVSPFSFFLPPVRGRSSNLARSGLSLQLLRLLTFTFRRPLQRALQRQLASSSPPSRLSLTTLAPSLLHNYFSTTTCTTEEGFGTKMQSWAPAPPPSPTMAKRDSNTLLQKRLHFEQNISQSRWSWRL